MKPFSQKIINAVCQHFDMPEEIIISKSRKETIRYPRQVLSYFLFDRKAMNCIEVAKYLSQDHSTVLSSVQVIKDRMSVGEDAVLFDIAAVSSLINGVQIFKTGLPKVEQPKIGTRPPTEYSNNGYLNLLKKYA